MRIVALSSSAGGCDEALGGVRAALLEAAYKAELLPRAYDESVRTM